MSIRTPVVIAAFAAFLVGSPASPQSSPPPIQGTATQGTERVAPWHSDTSDVPADTKTVYGRLANGMRYAIRVNDTPREQVAVRMQVDFGSAAEAENERGLAHFIEHMAFNGTTNVPEGEMVKRLERLGLGFGAHTNASTSYTETIYQLDLPRPSDEHLDTAFLLLRETASEILFNPKAVDRERGVVLEEMRKNENFAYQSHRARNELYVPGSYMATRYPIGTTEVLTTAPAARMKALYDKWYTPDRTTIVISGPVDPAKIEARLVAAFGSWQGVGAPLGELDRCTIDATRPAEARAFSHAEITEGISVGQYWPLAKRADSIATRRERLLESFVTALIDRRLQRATRGADAPFLGASVSWQDNVCDTARSSFISLSAKDGRWREALSAVEQSVRQAAQFGFSAAELEEQRRGYVTSLENSVKSWDTVSSGAHVARLLSAADNDGPALSTPVTNFELWRDTATWLTLDRINAHAKRWYNLDRPLVFMTGKNLPEARAAELTAALTQSRAIAVKPQVERVEERFAYTDFGTPGSVVSDTNVPGLGIRTIRFANGVHLNLKSTDFEDNILRWSLRIDGGSLSWAKPDAAYSSLFGGAFVRGGLAAHDFDMLQSQFSGSTAAPSFGIGDDYLGGSGRVAPTDLTVQLQLLAAYMTAPGYRAEALAQFRRPLPEAFARLHATPGGALGVEMSRILAAGDPRFAFPELADIDTLGFERLRELVEPSLQTGAIEIGLVGDFDADEAIKAVAATLGALPPRALANTTRAKIEPRGWSVAPGTFTIAHRGEPDQLAWTRLWPTTDDSDLKLAVTMNVLADVFGIMFTEELRERLGASYGGSASSSMSDIFKDFGQFSVSTLGDVSRLAEIEAAVARIAAELISRPVDPDLFARAREASLKAYETRLTRNATWAGIVDEAQLRPESLVRFEQSELLYKAVTPADVHAAALRFLKPGVSYTFRSVPAGHALAAGAVNRKTIAAGR